MPSPAYSADAEIASPPSYIAYWIGVSVLTVLFLLCLLLWPPMLGGVTGKPHVSDTVLFFGRFHPIAVHLPIGALILSLMLDAAGLRSGFEERWRDAALFIGFVGMAGTLSAVMFGIFLSREGGYTGADFILHQGLGLIASFGTIITMFLRLAHAVNPRRVMLDFTRFFMVSTFGLLSLGAHFGGNMVHGSKYLTEFAPAFVAKPLTGFEKWLTSFFEKKKEKADASASNGNGNGDAPKATTPAPNASKAGAPASAGGDKLVFQHVILPVLEAKCNKCHNEAKSKGDLRMDTYELAMKGGENGKNLVAGKPEDSLAIQRMKLPADDDDHMPPDGKDQTTKEEIDLIAWWVKEGASDKQKVSDAKFPAELQATVDAILKK